jgi:carboxymethylenebutenolidase
MTENAVPEGYFAQPKSGSGRGVLVLHPWWGLNDTLRGVCDRLAAASYSAFAPDLYHGQIATTLPEAEVLSHALDTRAKEAFAEIVVAADFLQRVAAPAGQPLAVIGYSLGAYFALVLSNTRPDLVSKVVVFYGTGALDYTKARASYQGHFAENDPYEPTESVDALAAALQQAGRPAQFFRYPGTGHWFSEPDRSDAYAPAAAELAWQRTLKFLK